MYQNLQKKTLYTLVIKYHMFLCSKLTVGPSLYDPHLNPGRLPRRHSGKQTGNRQVEWRYMVQYEVVH